MYRCISEKSSRTKKNRSFA